MCPATRRRRTPRALGQSGQVGPLGSIADDGEDGGAGGEGGQGAQGGVDSLFRHQTPHEPDAEGSRWGRVSSGTKRAVSTGMGMTLIGFWYPLSRMTWATVSETTTAKSECW